MISRLSSIISPGSKHSDKSEILDLLFPRSCPGCGENPVQHYRLCSVCESSIEYLDKFSKCSQCGVPFGYFEERSKGVNEISTDDGHLCSKCLKGRYSFKKARSVTVYSGVVRELIHAFKYEGKLKLTRTLSNIIIENPPFDLSQFDALVPVPLYIAKLRQRQYNQSAELAKVIGRSSEVKADLFGLIKVRDTLPQIKIKDEAERRRNVRGAFKVRPGRSFKGQSVLLVDDVLTTGSTSDECCKTLLKSGAKSASVLTLSRARSI